MRRSFRDLLKRFLVSYLMVAVLVLTAVPIEAQAMFLPSSTDTAQGHSSPDHQQNLERVQKLLESKLVSQRLSDLGFSQGEILPRLNQLSDQQLHYFAAHLESLQTGGDGLGVIIVLLVIAILVVVLLQLTGHKVMITK